MIKLYSLLKEAIEYNICGFDFDGVMHRNMDERTGKTIYSLDYIPFTKMHDKFREEKQKFKKVILVTARHELMMRDVNEFCNKYNLDFDEYYATNNKSKKNLLIKLGVNKFYDDNPMLQYELKGTGIEFILVNPRKNNWERKL